MLVRKRPPPREVFFGVLQVSLNPTELERVSTAYYFSKYGHAKQERDDGSRYFDHPKAAAWIYIHELGGRDADAIVELLLHDLSEDQQLLTPYRISLNFGQSVALDLAALTKLPKGKETTEEYLGRVVERGGRVIAVKLFDRLHNLRDAHNKEKHARTVEETKKYHLPILIPALEQDKEWMTYAPYFTRELTSLCS
jgi:(p)ppGpp synthase/HD superfamily hydrolase